MMEMMTIMQSLTATYYTNRHFYGYTRQSSRKNYWLVMEILWLMDATYKTTKYELAMFSVCV